MKNHSRPFHFSALIAVLLLVLIFIPVQMDSQPAPRDYGQIDAYIREMADRSSIPGISYAIVDDGQVVHIGAYGINGPDGQAVTPQTPMIIGSVGKTITALAVRQLVNEGLVNLDAPVQRYLPWFTLADEKSAAQITIGMLLNHTSGISTVVGNSPAFYRPGPTSRELVENLKTVKLDRPVGTTAEYSNINYIILGQIIEAVSGVSYADYVQMYIFTPLEMNHSYLSIEKARADGMGSGYRFYFGIAVAEDVPYPLGPQSAGFHISTAEDMAHYVIAFSNHGMYKDISIVHRDGLPQPGDEKLNYDIDWNPYYPAAGDTPGHSGGWLNYSAGLLYVPSDKLGVVILGNAFPTQWLPAKSTFEIGLDVLRLYLGLEPLPQKPALLTLYLIVDAVLLVLAGLVVSRVFSLRGWRARMAARPKRFLAVLPSLLLDVLLPLLLLLVLPIYMVSLPGQISLSPFFNWGRSAFSVPDLTYALLILSLVLMGVGLVKFYWLVGKKIK